MRSVEQRFEDFVVPEPNTGCWLWTGASNQKGYGVFGVNGKLKKAHRWSYEHHVAKIPEGLEIDHVRSRGCVGPSCVNPAHLEAVTHQENSLRSRIWLTKLLTIAHGEVSNLKKLNCELLQKLKENRMAEAVATKNNETKKAKKEKGAPKESLIIERVQRQLAQLTPAAKQRVMSFVMSSIYEEIDKQNEAKGTLRALPAPSGPMGVG